MRLALALLALPALGWLALAPHTRAADVTELRDGVFLVRRDGHNAVLARAPDGAILVDGTADESMTRLAEGPIRYVVATHADATRALERPTTGTLVTHDNTAKRADRAGATALRFRSRLTAPFGEGAVTLHYKGAAHTDGDVVVHFENARVLVVGGLMTPGAHPVIDGECGADLRGWIRVLTELERDFRDADVIVVGDRGAVGDLGVVREQMEYFHAVLDEMEHARRQGMTLDEVLERAGGLRERFQELEGDFDAVLTTAFHVAGN